MQVFFAPEELISLVNATFQHFLDFFNLAPYRLVHFHPVADRLIAVYGGGMVAPSCVLRHLLPCYIGSRFNEVPEIKPSHFPRGISALCVDRIVRNIASSGNYFPDAVHLRVIITAKCCVEVVLRQWVRPHFLNHPLMVSIIDRAAAKRARYATYLTSSSIGISLTLHLPSDQGRPLQSSTGQPSSCC